MTDADSRIHLYHTDGVLSALQIDSANHESSSCSVFDRFRRFHCSDPRDKVYALLSFLPVCRLRPLIQPDYSKSIAEIFEETTVKVFNYCQTLGLLSEIEHDCAIDEDWPSWVPRWDHRRTIQILHKYASGRAHLSLPRIRYRPTVLVSEGIRISTMTWCGVLIGGRAAKSANGKSDVDLLKQPFQEWLSKYLPLITDSTDPLLLRIAMTLTVGLDFDSKCPPLDLSQFHLNFFGIPGSHLTVSGYTGHYHTASKSFSGTRASG